MKDYLRTNGVSPKIVETWVRRDFRLTGAELKAAIELRNGACPEIRMPTGRGITPRDVYLANVVKLLPEMAKRGCVGRVSELAGIYAHYLFPRPDFMEMK